MKEERKRILEMVQNGKLTIEEAEKLLSVLEEIETEKGKKEEKISKDISPDVDFNTEYDQTESQKESFSEKKSDSTKDKIVSLIETALNKIKEIDLDFHHSVDATHTYQQNFSEFNDVYIEIPNGSLELQAWDHGDVRVECNAKVYRTEDPVAGKEKLLENLDIRVSDQRLVVASNDKIMRVNTRVYIPERAYEKITAKLFNGPIKGDKLSTNLLEFKTANGKVDLTNSKAEKAEIETANGAITIYESTISNMETETINGKVTIDGNFEKLDVQTIGGSIFSTIRNKDADTVRIESATGSVYVKVPKEASVVGELKSNIGNVNVSLENVSLKEEVNEIIQKQLKFEKTGETEKKIFILADSKMGSVNVDGI